jgi:hypothetical protein
MSPENKQQNPNNQAQPTGPEDPERASLIERTRRLIGNIGDVAVFSYGFFRTSMEERGVEFGHGGIGIKMPENSSDISVTPGPRTEAVREAVIDSASRTLSATGDFLGARYAAIPRTDEGSITIGSIADRLLTASPKTASSEASKYTAKRKSITSEAHTEDTEDRIDLLRGKDKRRDPKFATADDEQEEFERVYSTRPRGKEAASDPRPKPKGGIKRGYREQFKRFMAQARETQEGEAATALEHANERLADLRRDPHASEETIRQAKIDVYRAEMRGTDEARVLNESLSGMGSMIFTRWAPKWAAAKRKNIGSISSGTQRLTEARLQEQRHDRSLADHIEQISDKDYGGEQARRRAVAQATPSARHLRTSPSTKEVKALREEIARSLPKTFGETLTSRFGRGNQRHRARIDRIADEQIAKAGVVPTEDATRHGDVPFGTIARPRITWEGPAVTRSSGTLSLLETHPAVLKAKASGDREALRKVRQALAGQAGVKTRRDLLADEGLHGDLAYDLTRAEEESAAKKEADEKAERLRAEVDREKSKILTRRMAEKELEDGTTRREPGTKSADDRSRLLDREDDPVRPGLKLIHGGDADRIKGEEAAAWNEYDIQKAFEFQEHWRALHPISKHDIKP